MASEEKLPEFGIKRDNEERRDGGCAVIFDSQKRKYAVGRHQDHGTFILFGGGINPGEEIRKGVIREVNEESGLHDFSLVENIGKVQCHYFNRNKKVNRVAYATCFLIILKSDNLIPTKLEEHENFSLEWRGAEEIIVNWKERNQDEDYSHWIYFLNKAVARIKELGFDAK